MIIIILRTFIVYFALLVTMRLMGKRQLGEMELTEFIVAALIADLAAHPLQDLGIPMINGLLPIIVLFCCEVLITWLGNKSIRLRSILYGKPSVLIKDGKIDQREMTRNRYTADELLQELRNKGCLDISKIQYAILETDGSVNVIKKAEELPVTAKLMGKAISEEGLPQIVISEGRVLDCNLNNLGRDRKWLDETLVQNKCENAEKVFLMTVDENEKIFLAVKENTI